MGKKRNRGENKEILAVELSQQDIKEELKFFLFHHIFSDFSTTLIMSFNKGCDL